MAADPAALATMAKRDRAAHLGHLISDGAAFTTTSYVLHVLDL